MIFGALSTSDGIALGAVIVAVIALGVAIWSVLVARGANKLSEGSNDIAREALRHTQRQTELAESAEQERAREASARAVMDAYIVPLIYSVQASMALFRPMLIVRNTGTRASGRVTVRLYMPSGSDGMAWDDEHTRGDRTRPITDPDLRLHDIATGAAITMQYIERTLENVSTTMPVEHRVILPVPIPGEGQGRHRIPVRVVVRAEHADEAFEWTDYVQTEYGPPPV